MSLKINSVITLGSISDNVVSKNTRLYFESLNMLRYRLKNPNYSTTGINLHAWITLPNYSVIDVSIVSALKCFGQLNNINYKNSFIRDIRHQIHDRARFCYHPILIGNDYLKKVNVRPEITIINKEYI